MTSAKKLSCGGKGPCCHIGYSHRHCEHCDMVIDTRPANWWYTPPTWLYRPYQPYWGTGMTGSQIGNNFGNVGNAANATGFAQALEASWKDAAQVTAGAPLNVQSLPNPAVAHVCEVNP